MQTVIMILQLIPALITALKALEEAIPGQGQGEAKIAALRSILEALDSGVGKLWPQVQVVVSILVKAFNDTGVFTKR
jgi:hypothetical protein